MRLLANNPMAALCNVAFSTFLSYKDTTNLRPALRKKAQAGSADVNLVARAQALSAPVAGGHLDGPALPEDARAEFAFVVADAILPGWPIEADVRVGAG